MRISQGSIYPALIRLEQQGLISTSWGLSETNRKVKFYALTEAGTKQLQVEVEKWERAAALVARVDGGQGVKRVRQAINRALAMARSRRMDRELDDEILAHLEMAERDAIARRPVARSRPA